MHDGLVVKSQSVAKKIMRRWTFDNPPLAEPLNAIRTPSAQPKFQGRQGDEAVKQIEANAD